MLEIQQNEIKLQVTGDVNQDLTIQRNDINLVVNPMFVETTSTSTEVSADQQEETQTSISWFDLILSNVNENTLIETREDGEIHEYNNTNQTYYRFIPNPYNQQNDIIYLDYNLTEILAKRVQTF